MIHLIACRQGGPTSWWTDLATGGEGAGEGLTPSERCVIQQHTLQLEAQMLR